MTVQLRSVLMAGVTFGLLASLAGCGSPPPDSVQVIEKATEAIAKATTYRLEGEATVTQDTDTTQQSLRLEYVSPDRTHTTVTEESGTGESIRIGQTEYSRSSDESRWRARQWPETFPPYNMAVMMVEMLGTLVELEQLADEKIDGVDCLHYRGSEDMQGRLDERKAELDPSQPDYEDQLRLLEAQRQSQSIWEFWLGKEDFLVRRLDQHYDVVFIADLGKETEREGHTTMAVTYTFYDFGQTIQIEPPEAGSVEGVALFASTRSTGDGGDDLEHYQVGYEITVTNLGIERATNVRIFLESPATSQGLQTMEASAAESPLNLEPGGSGTFLVGWEYNLATSSKEEFLALSTQDVLRATWEDGEGQQHEEVLIAGE